MENRKRPIGENDYNSKAYRQFRSLPPEALMKRIMHFLKEKYTGDLNLAVDLGCGSGQCTFLLAKHFKEVIGLDISESQLAEAKELAETSQTTNVQFKLSPGHSIPCEDETVQLITAATSAHWMDLPKVYEEGKRVLCPGGVMAFLCSGFPSVVYPGDETKTETLKDILKSVKDEFLKYMPPQVEVVFNEYKDIVIPMNDYVRETGYTTEDKNISINYIEGMVRSISGFQRFIFEDGEDAGEKYLKQLVKRLLDATGIEDLDNELLIQRNEYYVVMARK